MPCREIVPLFKTTWNNFGWLLLSVSLENPLNTVSVVKLSVSSKRHFVQLLQSCVVVPISELVENGFQFIVGIANNKDGVCVTLHGIEFRRSHPVGCG